jgi:hypothetical protein
MLLEFIERLGVIINSVINSPLKGILLSVITIATLLILKVILGYFVRRYVYQHAQLKTNAQNFMAERISKAFMPEDGIEFAYVKRKTQLIPKDEQLPSPQYLYSERFRE